MGNIYNLFIIFLGCVSIFMRKHISPGKQIQCNHQENDCQQILHFIVLAFNSLCYIPQRYM